MAIPAVINFFRRTKCLAICLSSLWACAASASDEANVKISLTVAAPACAVSLTDKSLAVEFETFSTEEIYAKSRLQDRQFDLHLEQCDTQSYSSVRVKFSGEESGELPGLLSLDSGSGASGLAIGMETLDGVALPLNQLSPAFPILNGENLLSFKAYVQGVPSAIARRSIASGAFHASAVFEFSYE